MTLFDNMSLAGGETSSTTVTPYQFEGHNFSIVVIDGELWFVAGDVARELGYREAYDLTRTLDEDEKGTHTVRTLGGDQDVSVISEPGLYRAIIQRRTNKKHDVSLTARLGRFQRWVFHDVLPMIRRTGSYVPQPALPDYTDPAVLLGCFKALQDQVTEKDEIIADMAPKVEAHDRIAESYGTFCRSTAAKMLNVPPHTFTRWLRTNGWTFRRPGDRDDLAYQSKIAAGYLEHKVTTGQRLDGTEWSSTQVRVTARGLTALAKAFPSAAKEVA